MTTKDIALQNEILRGVVGSTAHGTSIEGQDDRDEMGIFVEPPANVLGMTPIDHYVYRTAAEGERSKPHDLDLVMYSLRKFCRLAHAGNPTVILLLWLPGHIGSTRIGDMLIKMRTSFISKESGKRFIGYLTSQKMRLTGERTRTVNRPDLVEKYGYDTKFAMHALRLGLQGIELLSTKHMSVPPKSDDLALLRSVRTGQVNYGEAVRLINDAEAKLKKLVDECDVIADADAINSFMVEAHRKHWLYHEQIKPSLGPV